MVDVVVFVLITCMSVEWCLARLVVWRGWSSSSEDPLEVALANCSCWLRLMPVVYSWWLRLAGSGIALVVVVVIVEVVVSSVPALGNWLSDRRCQPKGSLSLPV